MQPERVPTPPPSLRDRAEQLLSFLSPKWGMQRKAAQIADEELQSYRNARYTRISGRRIAVEGRADFHLEVGYDRRELVDRARQLERDSVIAEGLLSRATENVIGQGFRLRACSSSDVWNEKVEKAWAEWCYEADVRNMATFNDLLALTYRSWLRDGDVGIIKLSDGKLQAIESDQIANPLGNIPTKKHIDGVNLDERGAPVSFLVVKDPDPQWASVRFGQDFTEVPARDMLFLARRQRHGQTRGLSTFSNISWLLDQIDGQIEAVTVAARMAACVGLVIERQSRMSGLSTTTDSSGNTRRKMSLEPGMIAEVGQGDKVTQVDPRQPGQNFNEFLVTLGRLVGLSFGLPLEVAFLDFSRTNYSSARAALLQAHQVWKIHQDMMCRFASDVYKWWLMREIKAGRIRARRDALEHDWITPGWKWVDPEKELRAQMAEVDAGVNTLTNIAQNMGRDFGALCVQRKRELDLIRENGLPEVRSTLTRDVVSAPSPGVESAPEGDEGEESAE